MPSAYILFERVPPVARQGRIIALVISGSLYLARVVILLYYSCRYSCVGIIAVDIAAAAAAQSV